MNKEIVKAMNKKKASNFRVTVKRWWRKNDYKIRRIIFFPIWIITVLKDLYNTHADSKEGWDEKRAEEILNYYVPRRFHWIPERQSFYYFDNGRGWGITSAKKYLKRKDRRFWRIHAGWFGGEMRDFMINKFELEGCTKRVGDCADEWTEIEYTLNNK